MYLIFLLAITLVISGCTSPFKRSINSSHPNLTAQCKAFISKLPSNFQYDWIEVPENWENSARDTTIHVFFYWNATALAGGKNPILFLNGGPGYSSHSSFERFQKDVSLKKLPVVFVDQRGNECSSPFPNSTARAIYYGSSDIVKDVEAIRKKILGAEAKWNVIGHSYGGLVARRYIEIAPQSLISVASFGFTSQTSIKRVENSLLAQKQALDRFLETYPDQKAYITKLRKKLNDENICFHGQFLSVCGSLILDLMANWLSFKDYFPQLRAKLISLSNSDGTINPLNLKELVERYLGGPDTCGTTTVGILELAATPFDRQDLWGMRRASKNLSRKGVHPDKWLLSNARWQMNENSIEKDNHPKIHRPLNEETIKKNLQVSNGPKFYIFSGQYDSVSPPETFAEEIQNYKGIARYKEFARLGHDGDFSIDVWKTVFPEYFK